MAWEEFEGRWQSFEGQLGGYEERSKHIDLFVRSKQHVIDSKTSVEELLFEVESLKPHHEKIVEFSSTILVFLRECSAHSAEALSTRLENLTQTYER